jgi:DNA helicase-2/ATP-dependent DNA helicase PcrA
MVNAANRIADLQLDPLILAAEAEAAAHSLFEHWGMVISGANSSVGRELGKLAANLAQSRKDWNTSVQSAIPVLLETAKVGEGAVSDALDDYAAWKTCMKEIRAEIGQDVGLAELLQGLALRSKEPVRSPDSVALLTIHSAKGLQFDSVYLIGLAEGEMPSWQSLKKGDTSAEMEEERRNCFVAITRTQEQLTLSVAATYRGWKKEPSRFLKEINLI